MKRLLLVLLVMCACMLFGTALAEENVEVQTHNFVFSVQPEWQYERVQSTSNLTSFRIDTGKYVIDVRTYSFGKAARARIESNSANPQVGAYLELLRLFVDQSINLWEFNSSVSDSVYADGREVVHGYILLKGQCKALCTYYVQGEAYFLLLSAQDADYHSAMAFVKELAQTFIPKEIEEPVAVVTADTARIRAEASLSGRLLYTAKKGESFVILEETDNWFVVLVNDEVGYLSKGVAEEQ